MDHSINSNSNLSIPSRQNSFLINRQNRLRYLLSLLFFHLLPSVFFGIVALVLNETARIINKIADACHAINPTNHQQTPTIIIQTQSSPITSNTNINNNKQNHILTSDLTEITKQFHLLPKNKITNIPPSSTTTISSVQLSPSNISHHNNHNKISTLETEINSTQTKFINNKLQKTAISIGSSLSPSDSLNTNINESIKNKSQIDQQSIHLNYPEELDDAVTQLGDSDEEDSESDHSHHHHNSNDTFILDQQQSQNNKIYIRRDDLFSVQDPSKSLRSNELANNIVSKRIQDYEKYLSQTGTETPIPLPSTDPLLEKTNVKHIPPLKLDGGKMKNKYWSRRSNSSLEGKDSPNQQTNLREYNRDGTKRSSSHLTDDLEWNNLDLKEKRRLLEGGRSGEVHNLFPSSSEKTETDTSHLSTADAPHGVESLRELIPTDFQTSPPQAPLLDELDEMNEEKAVVDIETFDRTHGEDSPYFGSTASVRTESYSSPDSPIQFPNRGKNRNSWLASDHDLFSEEPLMDLDLGDNRREEGLGIDDGEFSDMDLPLPEETLIKRSTEDYDTSHLMMPNTIQDEYESSSDDIVEDVSSPVTRSVEKSSWQSELPFSDTPEIRKRLGRRIKQKRGISDGAVFRQHSYDVGTSRTTLDDRPRSKFDGSNRVVRRFAYSKGSSRHSADGRVRRNLGARVGRSMSSNENRFSDWPEYKPSAYAESIVLSRRHVSDMSFGITARKENMLPRDFFTEDQDDPDYQDEDDEYLPIDDDDDDIPERGDERRVRKLFSRSAKPKEEHDMKTKVLKFLRIYRRSSAPANEFRFGDSSRTSVDKSNRRSGSMMEGEFKFECDLEQETLFSLLDQICAEIDYSIITRKPNYKLKLSVSVRADDKPLIISTTLSRTSVDGKTTITICRSKDDQSDATRTDLDMVGRRLQRRLASQVEYIEDSFTSLWLDDSEFELEGNDPETEID